MENGCITLINPLSWNFETNFSVIDDQVGMKFIFEDFNRCVNAGNPLSKLNIRQGPLGFIHFVSDSLAFTNR